YNDGSLGIQAELVRSHDTIRVYSKSGKIPEGAKARVLLLHGMGWNTSTHALWRNMTRVLADPQPMGTEHSAVEARKIHEVLGKDRILVGAEAIDMPAHGVGADATELVNNLSASVD